MGAIRQIRVRDCLIPQYQRDVDINRVQKIVKEWNPLLVGVVKVAANPNGSFNVIDGQHRVEALRKLGEMEVWAEVETGLSASDQAETFVQLQTKRQPVRPYDRHRALVIAGNERAIEIEGLLNQFGLFFAGSGGGENPGITTVSTFYRLHEQYGPELIEKLLRVTTMAWPEIANPQRFASQLVDGLGYFLPRYPEITVDDLVQRLALVNPVTLLRDAKAYVTSNAHGFAGAVARQILRTYNHKRSSRRIEDRMDVRVPTLAQARAYEEKRGRPRKKDGSFTTS